MKTKQNLFLSTLTMLAAVLLLNSCKKETPTQTKQNANKTEWVDETYYDVLNYILPSGAGTNKKEDVNSDCAIVTNDTVSMPHTRIIDYGTGCANNNGHIRKGQVILTYNTTDFLNTSGGYITLSLNNYYRDTNQFTGGIQLYNNGLNGSGNPTYSLDINVQRIRANGAGVDSITSHQGAEWTAGSNTPDDKSDDLFSLTGSIHAITAEGDVDSISILQALIKNRAPGCSQYFTKGVLVIHQPSQSDITIDFGDGTCDNLAVETQDGVSQTVTLDN